MKHSIIILVALAVALPAMAQPALQDSPRERGDIQRERIGDDIEEIQGRVGEIRQEANQEREEMRERITEMREEMNQKREEIQNELQEKRAELQAEHQEIQGRIFENGVVGEEEMLQLREKREAMQQEIEQKREAFKQTLEERKAQYEQEREQYKERIQEAVQTFSDERRKQAALRAHDAIETVNERITDNFSRMIERLEEVLLGAVAQMETSQGEGVNVDALSLAIDNAQRALDLARSAVEDQKLKVYEIPETIAEDEVRDVLKEVRDMLHEDLSAIRDLLKDALEYVGTVRSTLSVINQ